MRIGIPRHRPGQTAHRRVARRVAKVAAIVFVVLVAGVAALIAATHTESGRDSLRRRLEIALDGAFEGSVTIGSLEGSILGDLELRDLKITDAAGAPAVFVRRARAQFDLMPLLRKRVSVSSIRVDGLYILGIPKPAGPEEEGGGWTIAIADASVTHALVSLPAGDQRPTFQGNAGASALIADGRIDVRVKLDGTAVDVRLPAPAAIVATAHLESRGEVMQGTGTASLLVGGINVRLDLAPGRSAEQVAISAEAYLPGGTAIAFAALDLPTRRASGSIALRGADTALLVGGEVTPAVADADLVFDVIVEDDDAGLAGLRGMASIVSVRGVVDGKPVHGAAIRPA